MKKLLLIFSILLIANTFTSCKKEKDDDEKQEPNKTELLTSHEWHGVDAIEYTNGTQTNSQPFNRSFLFAVNNDYFLYNENDQLVENGNWILIDGDPAKLKVIQHSNSTLTHSDIFPFQQTTKSVNNILVFNIEKLTKDKLSLSLEGVNNNGDALKVVINLKK